MEAHKILNKGNTLYFVLKILGEIVTSQSRKVRRSTKSQEWIHIL